MPAHPAPAADIRTDFVLLIDGTSATAPSSLDVINPATGQVFTRCPAAGRDELDRAVESARRAFPGWRDMSFADRAARIRDFCQSLIQHQDELAQLLTMEQGKPLSQARDEITRAATQSEGLTKIPIEPQVIENNEQRRIALQWCALGVAGIITPWNAPIGPAAPTLVRPAN
jgi:acyl-CoA reductase-like NAD-dependent aldehyde dehydrogenase